VLQIQAAFVSSCVMRFEAPRAPPAAVVPAPAPAAGSAAPGSGRVLIDSSDGPADVAYVAGPPSAFHPPPRHDDPWDVDAIPASCTTPCWLELPYGEHVLRLTLRADSSRRDLVTVPFAPGSAVYRRALGRHEDFLRGRRLPGTFLAGLGAHFMVAGLSFTVFAAAGFVPSADPPRLLALSLGATALALAIALVGLGVIESDPMIEQAGAGVLFPAPPELPVPASAP
jgi:hypothetical protein